MCMPKMPKMPDAPPVREQMQLPDRNLPTSLAASDISRRKLAMSSSIYTSPTLGAPTTTAPLGTP